MSAPQFEWHGETVQIRWQERTILLYTRLSRFGGRNWWSVYDGAKPLGFVIQFSGDRANQEGLWERLLPIVDRFSGPGQT